MFVNGIFRIDEIVEDFFGMTERANRMVCPLGIGDLERLWLFAGLGGSGDGRDLGAVQNGMRAGGAVVKDGQADGSDHEDDRRPGGEPGKAVRRGAGPESGLRALAAEGACQV